MTNASCISKSCGHNVLNKISSGCFKSFFICKKGKKEICHSKTANVGKTTIL